MLQARQAITDAYGYEIGENWDPLVDLMVIAANPLADAAIRIAALAKATPYIHAPAKPIATDDDKPENVDTEMLMRKVAQQLLGAPAADRDKVSGEPEPEAKYNEGRVHEPTEEVQK